MPAAWRPWQAHDELLDRDVAVKVLAEHLSADPAARGRFEREARAVARLSSHPHVVAIYDVGECEGSVYIVMELMARGSLSDRLEAEGAVPREAALGWLADAACALDDAHAEGIVHRDVSLGTCCSTAVDGWRSPTSASRSSRARSS